MYFLKFESLCELNKLPALISLKIQNNPLLKGMTASNYRLQIVARISSLEVNSLNILLIKTPHRHFLTQSVVNVIRGGLSEGVRGMYLPRLLQLI